MSLGVIVCSHDQLFWCHLQHDPITVPLPHRTTPDRPHRHRHVARLSGPENLIFVLIQTEFGDLLRVSFDPHDGSISNLAVSYFNTIPAAIQLGLSRRGTSSARPSLEIRLFRAVSFGSVNLSLSRI